MDGAALALLLALAAAPGVEVRHPPGTLHGFPSMSDAAGAVIADGELTQELHGDLMRVRIRWTFRDGRQARESAEFRARPRLSQRAYQWVETRDGEELRRFEADLETGRALAVTRSGRDVDRDEAKLDLPAGGAFAGYGTALAVSQLPLRAGDEAELTFVAFTPKPRVVRLAVRHDGPDRVTAAGRAIPCVRFTLRPILPLAARLFVRAEDAHLWFTRDPPPALVRAEQNLVAKDDPRVVIDVIPRGAARAPAAAGRATPAR